MNANTQQAQQQQQMNQLRLNQMQAQQQQNAMQQQNAQQAAMGMQGQAAPTNAGPPINVSTMNQQMASQGPQTVAASQAPNLQPNAGPPQMTNAQQQVQVRITFFFIFYFYIYHYFIHRFFCV